MCVNDSHVQSSGPVNYVDAAMVNIFNNFCSLFYKFVRFLWFLSGLIDSM